MKLKFTLILLISSIVYTHGQQKWQIKLDGGLSLPISKYSKLDLSETFSLDGNIIYAEYFDKKDHGAAERGTYYTISAKRKLFNEKMVLSVNYGSGNNPVNVEEISDYYTEYLDDIFYYVFEQDDYRVNQVFVSAGYNYQVSTFSFSFEPIIGLSIMDFPGYSMTAYLKATDEFRFDVRHRNETEDSNTLLLGIQSAIDVTLFNHLLLGLSIRYLSANHDYVIEPKAVGIDSRERHDTVNYRVINVGLSLGILF